MHPFVRTARGCRVPRAAPVRERASLPFCTTARRKESAWQQCRFRSITQTMRLYLQCKELTLGGGMWHSCERRQTSCVSNNHICSCFDKLIAEWAQTVSGCIAHSTKAASVVLVGFPPIQSLPVWRNSLDIVDELHKAGERVE